MTASLLKEVPMSTDPAETIALSRFRVIADATNPRLSPAERGQIVRELARQSHEQPDGSSRVYSRGTLDRWVRAYRDQGLDGLKPQPRADIGAVRHHPEFLEEAARLRHELPARSAAQISAILLAPWCSCGPAHHPRAPAAPRPWAGSAGRRISQLWSLRGRSAQRTLDRGRAGR